MHAPTSPTTSLVVATLRPDDAGSQAARDEMRHRATFCDVPAQNPLPTFTPPIAGTQRVPGASPHLSPRQLTAISLLCAGHSLEHTAAKLRIHRGTLHRWRTGDPAFRAELHRRQRDLHDTAARRLRLTLLRSLQVVSDEVTRARHREDRVRTALALLRHLKLSDLLAPPDALTADHCADELVRDDRRARNLDPALPVTDDDRDLLFASLTADAMPDDPLPPTHRRLRGTPDAPPAPFPARDDAPFPDPDFEI